MKVGIIGASGYGGLELIRLLHNHPQVANIDLYSSSDEGKTFSSKYPSLTKLYDRPLEKIDYDQLVTCDVIFASTPAGVTTELFPPLFDQGPRLIDLAGDFRLKDPELYAHWYGKSPPSIDSIEKSAYGLTEWNRDEIRNAQLIANPGCYPTATLLSLVPLVKARLIDATQIIIDAKSGVSGAGNTPGRMTHFSETNENLTIYKLHEHQHIPEIEQGIRLFGNEKVTVTFTTHLIPMTRGIMTTSYAPVHADVTEQDLVDCLKQTYAHSPFIRVMTDVGKFCTKQVYGSNYCDIHVKVDSRNNRATIVAVIDNVVKGAAGQAIQNMNVQVGLDETTGLTQVPLFI